MSMASSLMGLLLASTVLGSPVMQSKAMLQSMPNPFQHHSSRHVVTDHDFLVERDCTGQHIFHSPNIGDAAANKQKWVDMGLTTTDLAIIMKEESVTYHIILIQSFTDRPLLSTAPVVPPSKPTRTAPPETSPSQSSITIGGWSKSLVPNSPLQAPAPAATRLRSPRISFKN